MTSIKFLTKEKLFLNELYIQQLEDLDVTYFPWAWGQGEIKLFLNRPGSFTLGIANNDKILGFLLGEILPDLNQFHLYKILIAPEHRKKGHAHTLLYEAYRLLFQDYAVTEIYLEVSSLNHGAISLYEEFQLNIKHRKSKYYSDGSDAYIMLGAINVHLFT